MISFNFNKDSFSFSNNVFNSSLLTPYAKIFLSKNADEEALTLKNGNILKINLKGRLRSGNQSITINLK